MPGSAPFMSGVPKGCKRAQASPGPGQYVHHSPLGANTSAGNVPNFSGPAQRGAWLRSDQVRENDAQLPGVHLSLFDSIIVIYQELDDEETSTSFLS